MIKKYKEILITVCKGRIEHRSGTLDRQLPFKIIQKVKADPNISNYDLAKKLNETVDRKLFDQVLTKRDECALTDDETYVKDGFKQITSNRVKFFKAPARA